MNIRGLFGIFAPKYQELQEGKIVLEAISETVSIHLDSKFSVASISDSFRDFIDLIQREIHAA